MKEGVVAGRWGSVLPSTSEGLPGETAPGHHSCSRHPGAGAALVLCRAQLRYADRRGLDLWPRKGMGSSLLRIAGDMTTMSQPAGRGSSLCLVPGEWVFSVAMPRRGQMQAVPAWLPISSLLPLSFAVTAASKQTERQFQSRQQ